MVLLAATAEADWQSQWNKFGWMFGVFFFFTFPAKRKTFEQKQFNTIPSNSMLTLKVFIINLVTNGSNSVSMAIGRVRVCSCDCRCERTKWTICYWCCLFNLYSVAVQSSSNWFIQSAAATHTHTHGGGGSRRAYASILARITINIYFSAKGSLCAYL